MPTLNRTSPDYVPAECEPFSRPVQVGAVFNLCPSYTPSGKGLLSWHDRTANEFRCAVLDDRENIFRDDVVEPGDVRTIYGPGPLNVRTGTTWQWEGTLYAFISTYGPPIGGGRTECYVADDPENPVSWSLHGTVQSALGNSGTLSGIEDVQMGGIPTVLDNGRWILPFHAWAGISGDLTDRIGMHYSDDQGATWTTVISLRRSAGLGLTAGPQSESAAYNPGDDLFHFGSYIGSTTQWIDHQSPDGITWDQDSGSTSALAAVPFCPLYYMDNGTQMFAAVPEGSPSQVFLNIYEVVNPAEETTWIDWEITALQGQTEDHHDGIQAVPLWLGNGLEWMSFAWRDRITRHGLKAWVIGRPAW